MTSLGSVCREKIAAAATELSVDSEIIKVCIVDAYTFFVVVVLPFYKGLKKESLYDILLLNHG